MFKPRTALASCSLISTVVFFYLINCRDEYRIVAKGTGLPVSPNINFAPLSELVCRNTLLNDDPWMETVILDNDQGRSLLRISSKEHYILQYGTVTNNIAPLATILSNVSFISFDFLENNLYWLNDSGIYSFNGFHYKPKHVILNLEVVGGKILTLRNGGNLYMNERILLVNQSSICVYVLDNTAPLYFYVLLTCIIFSAALAVSFPFASDINLNTEKCLELMPLLVNRQRNPSHRSSPSYNSCTKL